MESTHPGDHNNEKIKIGQTSQFSANIYVKNSAIFSTIFDGKSFLIFSTWGAHILATIIIKT